MRPFLLPRLTAPVHATRKYLALPDFLTGRLDLNWVSSASRKARSGRHLRSWVAPWWRPRASRIFWTIARTASSCTLGGRHARSSLPIARKVSESEFSWADLTRALSGRKCRNPISVGNFDRGVPHARRWILIGIWRGGYGDASVSAPRRVQEVHPSSSEAVARWPRSSRVRGALGLPGNCLFSGSFAGGLIPSFRYGNPHAPACFLLDDLALFPRLSHILLSLFRGSSENKGDVASHCDYSFHGECSGFPGCRLKRGDPTLRAWAGLSCPSLEVGENC